MNRTHLKHFIKEIKSPIGEEPYPVYSVTNNRGFIPSEDQFDKIVHSKNIEKYKRVEKGFFAYNPSRINVGSLAINHTNFTCAVSPMYTVFVCNENELLPKYLLYFLKSDLGLTEINRRTQGTVRFQLKFNSLCEIPMYIPCVLKQQEIVDLFEEIDNLRQKQRQALELTKQIIPSLFYEMFGDVYNNPKGFNTVKLGRLIEINPRDKINIMGEEFITFLPMSGIDSENGIITAPEKIKIKDTKGKGYSSFKKGDVLFAKITPCMQNKKSAIVMSLINDFGCGSTEFYVLRASGIITSEYLLQLLRLPEVLLSAQKNFTGTAGQQRVPRKFIEEMTIPLPDLILQRVFQEKIKEIYIMQKAEKESLEQLNHLFDSVMYQAFSSDYPK